MLNPSKSAGAKILVLLDLTYSVYLTATDATVGLDVMDNFSMIAIFRGGGGR